MIQIQVLMAEPGIRKIQTIWLGARSADQEALAVAAICTTILEYDWR